MAASPASAHLRNVWAAIARIPEPLYLLVGDRQQAQAHLIGSFALETVDDEEIIVLRGTDSHVHVDWSAITGVARGDQDGYDCLRFNAVDHPFLQLLGGTPSYRYPGELLAILQGSATS
jgi:hypothetical protein